MWPMTQHMKDALINALTKLRIAAVSLPIGWLMGIIVAIGLVPSALLGVLFLNESNKAISFAEKEDVGVHYLRSIWPIISASYADIENRNRAVRRIRNATPLFDEATAIYGAQLDVAEEARILRRAIGTSNATSAYSLVRTPAERLITAVGDNSNLILDPDLDSYYTMDIAVIKAPQMIRAIAEAQTAADNDQGAARLITADRVELLADQMLDAAVKALTHNPGRELRDSDLRQRADAMVAAARDYSDRVRNSADAAETNGAARRLRREVDHLWIVTTEQLDVLLESRIQTASMTKQISIGGAAIVIAIGLLLSFLLARFLTENLSGLRMRIEEMADGDYTSEVPAVAYRNDIGTIARAIANFIDTAGDREALAGELAKTREDNERRLRDTVAAVERDNARLMDEARDHERSRQAQERDMIARLSGDLEKYVANMIDEARGAASHVDTSAVAMNRAARTTQMHAQSANDAARAIRDAVGLVAPQIATVTGALGTLRHDTDVGRTLAMQSVAHIEAARDRVVNLKNAADQIDSLQGAIAAIAAQTNMLALNAAIEAARSTDGGAGFRVVADEVKSLAASARKATEQIAEQIAGIRAAGLSVEQAFGDVTRAMVDLSDSATNISNGIAQQSQIIIGLEDAVAQANATVGGMTRSIAEPIRPRAPAPRPPP
ncbi:MAG: methyl-accepting chemotaxis protein, partial [Sphingomonadales bacterium]|nr:methyl-accepting chemotaxis protein [Sphingomonadales bacterium]